MQKTELAGQCGSKRQNICREEAQKESEIISDSENKKSISWQEGRRIVELGVLVDELAKGCCVECSEALLLQNTQEETKVDLGNILYI